MKKLYGLCLHKSCDLFYSESFFYVGKLKLFIWVTRFKNRSCVFRCHTVGILWHPPSLIELIP